MTDYEELINQLNERASLLVKLGLEWGYYRPSDAALDRASAAAIMELQAEVKRLDLVLDGYVEAGR